MKLFYVLAFAALLVISTSKIRKISLRNGRSESKATGDGLFYIFVKNTILSINHSMQIPFFDNSSDVDKCLPSTLKGKVLDKNEQNDVGTAQSNLNSQVSTWDSIKDLLKEGINFVCHFKEYVSEFKSYLANSLKSIFAFRRVFISRKKSRGTIVGFLKDKAESFEKYSKQLLTDIQNKVQIVTATVKATLDDARNYISSSIENFFSPIIDKFNQIKEKVKDFWNSPLIQKIRDYINTCGKGIKTLLNLVVAAFKTIAELVTLRPDAWFSIILKMICNWQKLLNAVKYVLEANKSGAAEAKWANIGNFVGVLIYIFSL